MAIGIGVYAGLGSTATWRRASNDASFGTLHMHDLRVTLSPGTFTDQGTLAEGVAAIDAADQITAAEERLVVDSQLDASTDSEQILVQSRVVGMDMGDANSGVDLLWVRDGRVADTPAPATSAVLEAKFADAWDLPPEGAVVLAGNQPVNYAGLGAIPEDFLYEGPEGSIVSLGELAPLYLPLAEAQSLLGRPGQVNDLVLTLLDEADRAAVSSQLETLARELGVSATVTTREDAEAVRLLYEDIENDQRLWNAFAGMILVAAALAAFNLISRIVEAQRREIGIGMALGVPRRRLAIRPLLVGIQVALLGTIAGIGVGLLMGRAMKDLLESFLPLPVYLTDFQPDVFARAALLGLVIPVVAAAIPVWRAVRVEPIEAIRTGHLTAKTSRLTDWSSRIRLPGSTTTQMPIRNVLRTPRRTVFTAIGIGAAITALVGTQGMLDSVVRSIDQVGAELSAGDPDRLLVQLDTFYSTDSAVVRSIAALPSAGTVQTNLRLPATAGTGTTPDGLDLLVEVVDLDSAGWTPTLVSAQRADQGLILARKAADDLGVAVGDTVTVRHPVQRDGAFGAADTEMAVTGIHANPLRIFAYVDSSNTGLFGLTGLTNIVSVSPAAGAGRDDLQSEVFDLPGIASIQAVARVSEGFDDILAMFVGFLAVAALAVLILAVLIAFNATRIVIDERRREHATMRAFGLPVRSVVGVVMKESVLIGILATIIGVGAGLVFLEWMLESLASTTLPDLGITRYLAPATIVIAVAVGTIAVAAAPLFLVRRIRRMNIPDTLRVME